MPRHDYAFPFRIDGASRHAQRSAYAEHVRQMIRQVLLTSPGERVNLPEFGCGLRQLIFAPLGDSLAASVKIVVLQALTKWLSGHIKVNDVTVVSEAELGELRINVEYTLIDTQTIQQIGLRVP